MRLTDFEVEEVVAKNRKLNATDHLICKTTATEIMAGVTKAGVPVKGQIISIEFLDEYETE